MSRSVSQTVILLHRDLSVYNLMYEVGNVIIFGILNDFDLSVILKDDKVLPAASSKRRTGTATFMAYKLLNTRRSVEHLYRHELESFLYIMVWTAVGYKGRKLPERKKDPLMGWRVGDWRSIYDKKVVFFSSESESEGIMGEITEKYEMMRDAIIELHSIFQSAFGAAIVMEAQAQMRIMRSLREGDVETDEIKRESVEKVQQLLSDALTWDKVSHLFDLRSIEIPGPVEVRYFIPVNN